MACEECSKCWFNYIEECEGQENYRENKCMKRKELYIEDKEAGNSVGSDVEAAAKNI